MHDYKEEENCYTAFRFLTNKHFKSVSLGLLSQYIVEPRFAAITVASLCGMFLPALYTSED